MLLLSTPASVIPSISHPSSHACLSLLHSLPVGVQGASGALPDTQASKHSVSSDK